MEISKITLESEFPNNSKLNEANIQLQKLIDLLRKKDLPDHLIAKINSEISYINTTLLTGNPLRNLIRKKQAKIVRLVEKEVKIVPANYYKNLWLALGMSAFGLPMGVALGVSLGNMAFLGIGLPIGLAMGIAIGTGLDKKAKEEGRQLDIVLKN